MVKNRKGLIVSWKPDLRSIEEKKHWLLNSAPSMDPSSRFVCGRRVLAGCCLLNLA